MISITNSTTTLHTHTHKWGELRRNDARIVAEEEQEQEEEEANVGAGDEISRLYCFQCSCRRTILVLDFVDESPSLKN